MECLTHFWLHLHLGFWFGRCLELVIFLFGSRKTIHHSRFQSRTCCKSLSICLLISPKVNSWIESSSLIREVVMLSRCFERRTNQLLQSCVVGMGWQPDPIVFGWWEIVHIRLGYKSTGISLKLLLPPLVTVHHLSLVNNDGGEVLYLRRDSGL